MKQLPNFISIFRTMLAIVISFIVLDNPHNEKILFGAFLLTWFVIILDGVDGIIARKLNLTSDFGAFFDIACDRIIELIYLLLFAVLRWIPFLILIIFLVRGVLVDGIRGFALREGKTAFGEKSMMQSKLGLFLTSSRFTRASYGTIKAIAFALMFMAQNQWSCVLDIEMFLIYLMTFYCIIRGVPVLVEGRKFFS